jgi:hypothetical protein
MYNLIGDAKEAKDVGFIVDTNIILLNVNLITAKRKN